MERESAPLMKSPNLAEDVQANQREASHNNDLDKEDILLIDRVLQSIQCELVNNTSKLTQIEKRIKRTSKS